MQTRAQARKDQQQAQQEADLALDEFFGGIATEPRLSGGVSTESPSPVPKTVQEPTKALFSPDRDPPSQPIPVNMNLDVDKVIDYQRVQEFLKEEVPDEWTTDAVAFIQSQDRDLSTVREWLTPGKPPPTWQDIAHENAAVKAWWGRLEQLHFSENGILYLKWESDRPKGETIYRVLATPPHVHPCTPCMPRQQGRSTPWPKQNHRQSKTVKVLLTGYGAVRTKMGKELPYMCPQKTSQIQEKGSLADM